MSLTHRKLSSEMRAANVANSRKSTGPKTPPGKRVSSLNALSGASSARPLWQPLTALGEDPARYRTLLQGVVRSYPPRNPLELRLCQDVTRLLLETERNQQAREAKLIRIFEKLQNSREKHRREIEMDLSYDAPQAEVLETGLLGAPDSPAKHRDAAECLERLLEKVEQNDFSDESELQALYGKQITFRGAGIINSFHNLASARHDRTLRASLNFMIHEELRNLAEAYQAYLRDHVEITRAMRVECLQPADQEYARLQRQEAVLDQRLERKIRLLLAVRASRLEQPPEDGIVVDLQDPMGWLGASAARGRKLPRLRGIKSELSEDQTTSSPLEMAPRAIDEDERML